VKGARAVAGVLQDDLDFDAERIILLENEAATQRAIRRAFVDPLGREEKVGPDDRVLVYFGGHGLTYDTAEGEIGCIAPYDIEKAYWDTAIPMDELTRLANRIHAKHVLFLLDACFSGFATTRQISTGVQRQVDDYLTRPARQVISAGTRDQLVADTWGPGGHALFTGFLLEGLGGAAPTPGGVLRAFHLAGYIQDAVATHSHSKQTPQYAALMGSRGGDFVFSVRDIVALPTWLVEVAESRDPTQRLMAVGELRPLAHGEDPDVADMALARLADMAENDPDEVVRSSAQATLRAKMPGTTVAPVEREEPVVPEPEIEPPEPEEAESPEDVSPPEPEEPSGLAAILRRGADLPSWVWGAGAVAVVAVIIGLVVLVNPFVPPPTPTPSPTEPTPVPVDEIETAVVDFDREMRYILETGDASRIAQEAAGKALTDRLDAIDILQRAGNCHWAYTQRGITVDEVDILEEGKALAEATVDRDGTVICDDGERPEYRFVGPNPALYIVEDLDGDWIVTDYCAVAFCPQGMLELRD
jgi:hypothetical protein